MGMVSPMGFHTVSVSQIHSQGFDLPEDIVEDTYRSWIKPEIMELQSELVNRIAMSAHMWHLITN